MSIDFGFIYGIGLGFEILPDDGSDDLIKSAVVIDLLIVRIAVVTFRK